jgi:dTMP kinase
VAAGEDRFERKDPGFHERLRDGYLAIAQREPGRCKIIESSGDAETVFQSVLRHLNAL